MGEEENILDDPGEVETDAAVSPPTAADTGETYEVRKARQDKEDYLKRFEESMEERRKILQQNGIQDNAQPMSGEESWRRCCA